MRTFVHLFLLSLICACSKPEEPKTEPAAAEVTAVENDPGTAAAETKLPPLTLKQYPSVMDMLKDVSEFKETDKTLKLVAPKPLHIQVSQKAMPNDSTDKIALMAKRDIVDVALQAFAQTDIDFIQITALPLQLKSDFTFGQYLYKQKLTAQITREEADKVMQKYLGSTDYKKLFHPLEGGIYTTSDAFEKLKHEELDNVYADLTGK